jgi:hypothetical protein
MGVIMTFGNQQNPVEAGKKGAAVINNNSDIKRKAAITRWKSKEYREKFKKCMKGTRAWSKEHLSEMGKRSRIRENSTIENIRCEFDRIFLPQEACDRIAIKNGELFFIEVKDSKQKLTPKQKELKEIAKHNYIVIRSV